MQEDPTRRKAGDRDVSVFQAKREYTCWIDPENRVSRNTPEPPLSEQAILFEGMTPRGRGPCGELTLAYDAGFVRVRYEGSSALRLTGTPEALTRSQPRWQALAAAVEKIHVELVSLRGGEALREVSFDYPQELVFLDILLSSGGPGPAEGLPASD